MSSKKKTFFILNKIIKFKRTIIIFVALLVTAASLLLVGCNKNDGLNKKLNSAYRLQSQKDIDSLKAAVAEYEEIIAIALEAVRGSFEAQKLLGIQFALNKNYSMCATTLQEAIDLKAEDDGTYYYLGLCYTHLARAALENIDRDKNINLAENVFSKGIAINSENSLLHYGKGVLLGFVLNKTDEAIDSLELARKYNNEDVNVLFALASLNYKLGHADKAAGYYRSIINIMPEDSEKWNKAKINLIEMGKGN